MIFVEGAVSPSGRAIVRVGLVLFLWLGLLPGSTVHASLIGSTNGTVTDTRTGLVWQQAEPGAMDWGSALAYCQGLDLGGSVFWRLPNMKELESLSDDTRLNPAIDTTFFPGAALSSYWSSTSYAFSPSLAWYVYFASAHVNVSNKYGLYYVRCVSGGETGQTGSDLVPGLAGVNAIALAVDQSDTFFTTTAAANWSWQAAVAHDGQDAARSGGIGANQASSFQTTGRFSAGTVSFWWKVSSELVYDLLRFSVDGVVQDEISGEVDWQQKYYPVTSGTHTLRWEYSKDSSHVQGFDTGWVDQLVLPVALAANDVGGYVRSRRIFTPQVQSAPDAASFRSLPPLKPAGLATPEWR